MGDGSAGESGEVGWAKRTLPRRFGGAMSLSVSVSSASRVSGCREGSVWASMLTAVPALLFLGDPLMEDHEDTLCDMTGDAGSSIVLLHNRKYTLLMPWRTLIKSSQNVAAYGSYKATLGAQSCRQASG